MLSNMKNDCAALLATTLLSLGGAGAAQADVVERRALSETVAVDGAGLEVVVDNVFGSIRVTAHDEDAVEMTATETLRGDVRADIERARAEVELRTVREEGRVAFLVRRRDGACVACGWPRRWDGYTARYDIELRVPRDSALDLETVTDGDIVVEHVRGRFDVSNVNGAVRLSGLRAAGRAATVNGRLTAVFERAPADSVSFKTVNGEIDVEFPRDLSADLEFKTMHGEIWSDFEVASIVPAAVSEPSPRGPGTVVRMERRTAARVGAGGPVHSFETLNGDILVRRSR